MMGAGMVKGSSEEAEYLQKTLEDQTDVIRKLEMELKLKNNEIFELKQDMGIPREGSVSSTNKWGRVKQSVKEIATKRRDEVSAEVFSNIKHQISCINLPDIVPKVDQVKEIIGHVVDTNILFKDIPDGVKMKIIDAFHERKVEADSNIISQGDLYGEEFYVVESGELSVFLNNGTKEEVKEVLCGTLSVGQSFGELALLYNTARAATVRSNTDCKLWVLSRKTYNDIKLYYAHQRHERMEELLHKVTFFENLKTSEVSKLADAVSEEKFEKETAIIREGEVGEHFYIIIKGRVAYETRSGGTAGEASDGDYFGHKALFTDELRQATVTAITDVECLVLGRQDFVALLGSLQDVIDRNGKSTVLEDDPETRVEQKTSISTINFSDLKTQFEGTEIILGQGAFGKVLLVTCNDTSYALKCLSKTEIVRGSLIHHVLVEREVLNLLDFEFIAKFYASYWDDYFVYFLMEVCLGGELFTLLQAKKKFTEKATKFFAATVLKTFEYLHSLNIIYRDLKPENLMLDSSGYLKVVDFGLAKLTKGKTWTLCGTPDYIAPEIISMSGHSKAVDFWTLGVLIYELTVGRSPYASGDQLGTYEKILKRSIKFPASLSNAASNLISKLNKKDPSKRLGSGKDGPNEVMKNIWFAGFDWEKLMNREMEAPVQVQVQGETDLGNFPYAKYAKGLRGKKDTSWEPAFPSRVNVN